MVFVVYNETTMLKLKLSTQRDEFSGAQLIQKAQGSSIRQLKNQKIFG